VASVTFSGPFFDTEGDGILADGLLAARHAVADKGIELTVAAFDEHIRVNNGRHTASITVTDESRSYTSSSGHRSYTLDVDVPQKTSVVTTSNATYGPWLEGVGSRNATTRFKGYWGFRQAASELDGQAQSVAEEALMPYIEKLNG
jgi:hypothetical protein